MIPLRLVIDANIVVSAPLKPEGLQCTVLLLALTKPARLYVSPPDFRGIPDGAGPIGVPNPQSSSATVPATHIEPHSISPVRQLRIIAAPDDNIFMECADAARADYLVTGNVRHFPNFWKKTKIITSREFLSVVSPHLLT